jgi:large subunit ribosomal protein L30
MVRGKASAKESNNLEKVKVTLSSGLVGKKDTQRRVVKALGLKKYGSSAVHTNTASIAGMLRKVEHLVKVEAVK